MARMGEQVQIDFGNIEKNDDQLGETNEQKKTQKKSSNVHKSSSRQRHTPMLKVQQQQQQKDRNYFLPSLVFPSLLSAFFHCCTFHCVHRTQCPIHILQCFPLFISLYAGWLALLLLLCLMCSRRVHIHIHISRRIPIHFAHCSTGNSPSYSFYSI